VLNAWPLTEGLTTMLTHPMAGPLTKRRRGAELFISANPTFTLSGKPE